MDKLDFEYPVDFQDEARVEILPELPPFKASAILYVTSVSFLLGAFMITLMEILSRSQTSGQDTFIELLEWNPSSQVGVIGLVLGLFMFWLGLMVDRRDA